MSSAVSLNQYVEVMHTGVVSESETRGRPSRSPLCTACVESLHFLFEPLFAATTTVDRGETRVTRAAARARTALRGRAPTAVGAAPAFIEQVVVFMMASL